jgi:hypothetical protein
MQEQFLKNPKKVRRQQNRGRQTDTAIKVKMAKNANKNGLISSFAASWPRAYDK